MRTFGKFFLAAAGVTAGIAVGSCFGHSLVDLATWVGDKVYNLVSKKSEKDEETPGDDERKDNKETNKEEE